LPISKNLWPGGGEGKCLNANLVWFDDVLFCHGYGMGAPNTVFFAEIWHALGAGEIIFLGTAGALTQDFNCGEVFVVERALRDEGISFRYLEHDDAVCGSEKLTKEVREKLRDSGLPNGRVGTDLSHKVTIWTTDAIFRETP